MFIYKITPAYIDFICDNLTFHTNSSRVPKYVQNSFPGRLQSLFIISLLQFLPLDVCLLFIQYVLIITYCIRYSTM